MKKYIVLILTVCLLFIPTMGFPRMCPLCGEATEAKQDDIITELQTMGFVDTTNSSTTPLLGTASTPADIFTGTSTDMLNYVSGVVSVFADQDSAANGLSIEYSSDGTNWDHAHAYTISANVSRGIPFDREARYFRIVYTNGATAQGTFRLQTLFNRSPSSPHYHPIEFTLMGGHAAAITRSIIVAKKPNEDYINLGATSGGNQKFSLEEYDSSFDTSPLPVSEKSKTAFGEVLMAELTPIVQIHSAYNINTRIIEERNNGGTTSIVDNKFQVSTSAATNKMSSLLSRIAVKYNSGQGGLWRGTALFTTGVANSSQYIGIGTASEGYFFGYNGATFGIMRRQGGSPEIRTLTVSTGSSHAENITITLDGDADATVAVTNTGNITLTANEIADHDFSDLGQGWNAHSMGANVIFESFNALSQTGSYTLGGATSAIGTFAQAVAGVAPTETVIAQSSWDSDKFDGTGVSGVTLDYTKGNVYQIRYQWLGFGLISFYIEDPDDGEFHLVHKIEYANANTIPSIDNPTLPVCMAVNNTSNTSDIILQSSSMMGGIEGKDLEEGIINNITAEDTGTGTSETPIFSIHNHTVYQSKVNRVRVELTVFTASIDSTTANKPSTIRIRLNPILTGASPIIDFTKLMEKLNPGETVTISLESSSGNVDSVISMNWKELF